MIQIFNELVNNSLEDSKEIVTGLDNPSLLLIQSAVKDKQ